MRGGVETDTTRQTRHHCYWNRNAWSWHTHSNICEGLLVSKHRATRAYSQFSSQKFPLRLHVERCRLSAVPNILFYHFPPHHKSYPAMMLFLTFLFSLWLKSSLSPFSHFLNLPFHIFLSFFPFLFPITRFVFLFISFHALLPYSELVLGACSSGFRDRYLFESVKWWLDTFSH